MSSSVGTGVGVNIPVARVCAEEKRWPFQGCEVSRKELVHESKYKNLPHSRDLRVKTETSFEFTAKQWPSRHTARDEAFTQSLTARLGHPSGARGHGCLKYGNAAAVRVCRVGGMEPWPLTRRSWNKLPPS